MARSFRHLLVATLVALHAAVTLCGPGLHALPGLGHGSGLRPLARNDHSHGPGKSSHEAADECPVCQFLAQGQAPSDHEGGLAFFTAVGVAAPAAPAVVPTPPRSPSVPRGPPNPSSRPA